MWLSWKSSQSDLNESLNNSNVARDKVEAWHPGLFFSETRGPKYHCQVCLEFFPTMLSLSTHIKMHQRPTCFVCWTIFASPEELDYHNLQCHSNHLNVPQNSPEIAIKDEDGELDEDPSYPQIIYPERDVVFVACTPDTPAIPANELSFALADASTPFIAKRQYRRRVLSPPATEAMVVKKITTTRSGRKINFKSRED